MKLSISSEKFAVPISFKRHVYVYDIGLFLATLVVYIYFFVELAK